MRGYYAQFVCNYPPPTRRVASGRFFAAYLTLEDKRTKGEWSNQYSNLYEIAKLFSRLISNVQFEARIWNKFNDVLMIVIIFELAPSDIVYVPNKIREKYSS